MKTKDRLEFTATIFTVANNKPTDDLNEAQAYIDSQGLDELTGNNSEVLLKEDAYYDAQEIKQDYFESADSDNDNVISDVDEEQVITDITNGTTNTSADNGTDDSNGGTTGGNSGSGGNVFEGV